MKTLQKPSDVIQLIIESIDAKSKDKHFQFRMSSFGKLYRDNKINQYTCFGCLATATIHSMLNVNANKLASILPEMIDDKYGIAVSVKGLYTFFNNVIEDDDVSYLRHLENVIDNLRYLSILPLLNMFNIDRTLIHEIKNNQIFGIEFRDKLNKGILTDINDSNVNDVLSVFIEIKKILIKNNI